MSRSTLMFRPVCKPCRKKSEQALFFLAWWVSRNLAASSCCCKSAKLILRKKSVAHSTFASISSIKIIENRTKYILGWRVCSQSLVELCHFVEQLRTVRHCKNVFDPRSKDNIASYACNSLGIDTVPVRGSNSQMIPCNGTSQQAGESHGGDL